MATYSYGKKTRVRRSGVKAVGPTSAELERQTASMASYSPPGGGYQHDVGDIAGQTSVAKKKQMMAAAQQRYRSRQGYDGAPNLGTGANGTSPARVSPNSLGGGDDTDLDGLTGREMNARRSDNPRQRRRKGNRYYRTD
jgi:hypothetical protein